MHPAFIRRVASLVMFGWAFFAVACFGQNENLTQLQNTFVSTPVNPNQGGTTYLLVNTGGVGDNPVSDHVLPQSLVGWQDWALWDDIYRDCPRPFNNGNTPLPLWPSQLTLQATASCAAFQFSVDVRHRVWVDLPGDERIWPENVEVDHKPVPILRRQSTPAIQLEAGKHLISGSFSWPELPPRLALPREIGILSLTLEGKAIPNPTWGEDGFLIFQQAPPPASEKDFLEVKVYRLLEDGLPLILETQVSLNVSGRSREEVLGALLPKGWKLSNVQSALPIAIDEAGKTKVQVRAGRWVVTLSAYTLDPKAAIGYAPDVHPAVPEELVGFRSKPDFRVAKVSDLNPIDVTQTDFPTLWGNRDFPVYRWKTDQPFHVEETMRGMGQKNRSGLEITRQFWLDDRGKSLTYLDSIQGTAQERWRLDATEDNDLGAVQQAADQQDQHATSLLITKNPDNGALGIELRKPDISIGATGKVKTPNDFFATGWAADTDSLSGILDLPPGWRLIAMTGPDSVYGDWLTAWTLLDLFYLLIFTLVVWRIWGWRAGLVALVYYTLAYQEPLSPHTLWLFLLPPFVLLKYVKSPVGRYWLHAWKWLTLIPFFVVAFSFISGQLTSALYPQLEDQHGYKNSPPPTMVAHNGQGPNPSSQPFGIEKAQRELVPSSSYDKLDQSTRPTFALPEETAKAASANLAQDEKAKVQTGPAIPQRNWRRISFSWSGPVTPSERVHLYLIPPIVERLLDIIRVFLFLTLTAIFLGWKQIYWKSLTSSSVKRVVLGAGLVLILAPTLQAADPDDQVSDTRLAQLRQRLLTQSTAYPNAAEIASAALSIHGGILNAKLIVHAGLETAVPLPGRLPAWSPITVLLDGHPEASLRRMDGYLWIIVPQGIHQVDYQGMIPQSSDWSWSYEILKPHKLTIDAPEWTWAGLLPDGSLGDQIFFTRKVAKTAESDYGNQQLSTLVQLDRHIEFGQVWQIHNSVRRLTQNNSATSIRLPLLPNERVLSSVLISHDGFLEVPLSATQSEISWESELPKSNTVQLSTNKDDTWVEQWTLDVSPIWDVKTTGIEPIFDPSNANLSPIWQPWPGEKVQLTISRPQAVEGNTLTINSVSYSAAVGLREMTCDLTVNLKCSVGQEFYLDLPEEAAVTNLTLDGQFYPVHFDTHQPATATTQRLIVPLEPNSSALVLQWKMGSSSSIRAELPEITFLHSDDNQVKKVGCANSSLSMSVPESRVILWVWGPEQGPAVTLWVTLALCLLGAYLLSRVPFSPLGIVSWFLLALGLSQVQMWLVFIPLGWFFLLSWRGRESFINNKWLAGSWLYNLFQLGMIILTFVFMGICVSMVSAGLLGSPQMWIYGNYTSDQSDNSLAWFSSSSNQTPRAGFIAVSIWWYRLGMLLWSLWLANAALKWLLWAFRQMTFGGFFRPLKWPTRKRKLPTNLPPTPPAPVIG